MPIQSRIGIAVAGLVTLLAFNLSHAQVPPPITSSGLNTQVSDPITVGETTQFNITGGTRPNSGPNLFHSFGEFGVPTNNIANFLNGVSFDLNGAPLMAGLPTANILARVTEGNPSGIFGTIRTTDFGSANLFLMNPAGIVFGPTASLNVGGSVAFTTANYIRLFAGVNSVIFYADTASDAVTAAAQTSILSSAPLVDFGFVTPAAFGFLNSTPAAIAVQGSNLSVPTGQAISLVSGNRGFTYTDPNTGSAASVPGGITMTGGTLSAPAGQINLASVASPGEILLAGLQSAPNIIGQSFTTMGNITLSQGATLDVFDNAAGTVRIRGGQLMIDNATISADTGENNGAPIAVDIDVTGDLSISSNQASAITARATGSGNAGEIRLNSAKLDVNFAFPEFGVVIDSSTVGSGNAGKVTVTTGDLTAANKSSTEFISLFIDSGTGGGGNGGDVTIKVLNGDFQSAFINTGDAFFFGTGSAGNLYIGGHNSMADSLHFDSLVLNTEAFSAKGGSITLEGRDILITNNTSVSSTSLLGENPITIEADRLVMDHVVRVQSATLGLGNGGDIVFRGETLEMTNDSSFLTRTYGDGDAGAIRVFANDGVRIVDGPIIPTASGLYTNSLGELFGMTGKAGPIEVTTMRLDMTGGARLETTTLSGGNGGDVTITAPQGIFISGQRAEVFSPPENFGLGFSNGSGIYTRSIGTEFCGGPCGNAGSQILNTGSLVLNSGGTLDSGTTGTGAGGTILVNATNQVVISGTLNDGTPGGVFSRTIGAAPDAGSGGNITLTAGQSFTISDGASVSASSTGPGNAGNISIDAGQQFDMRDSSVTTKSEQAGGGNIEINATKQIRLVNSQVNASAFLDGGNITIDPLLMILQNSQILAQAIQGAGGNITIFTPLYLRDSSSVVSASSQFGLNGTVTIQSPTSNLSESLGTLTSTPSQAQSLLTQRCAALANGQASSFVVAGREQLPADPGGWLTSPLAFAGIDAERFGDGTVAEGILNLAPRTSGLLANDRVSLRRLTPVGFLIANFADSEATGCHS